MTIFLQASFEGLALGAVYSLVAIGLVLIYKAMDVLSFAQPALAVVGAGIISALAVDRGINFWVAFIVALIATGIIGALSERIFLRPMVGEPVFSVAILTLGLDVLYRTVLDNWIGVNPRYMGDPIFTWGEFGSITIGGVVLKFQEIGALITAILAVVFLGYFFKVSKYGLAMRATSFDQEASLAQGINVGRIFGLVWFIAGILAAFSGFFITGGFNLLTQASFISAFRALPAVVIGGLDSIPGAIVGSIIIGLTQGYVAYYQFPFQDFTGINLGNGFSLLAPYLIMFVILIIKPDGLFGTEEVERV
ncbi:MAG: branched-chain amino acid ABC transporter permease [Candidatus Actinomarina sp.]|tara:strand:+ start:837 stop:1757 length:921 start_codon:yes stop_codon:yes gene_type:complete